MDRAPHCVTCAGYEERIMARRDGEAVPDDLRPCTAFVASDRFQSWAVDQMRREVQRQVSRSGLDRMAVLKAGPSDTPSAPRVGSPRKGA